MATTKTIKVVDAESMGATFNGTSASLRHANGYALQFIWSAGSTPTGTVKLQASLDDSTWDDITGASESVSGSSGSVTFNAPNAFYHYVRPVYTRSGGTATANAYITIKG